jgi:hypothetical protein
MVYAQNQGLSDAVDDMHAFNENTRNRPVTPYRPPNVGASGLKTYGGGYGRMAPPPGGGLFGGTPVANQAAPMAQALGFAPTTQSGYDEQMAAQNPNGRFFGGALPTTITSANGTQRPGYMAPPAQDGGVGFDRYKWAQSHGYYIHPTTGAMIKDPGLMSASPAQIRGWQVTGQGPNYQPPADLAERQAAYQARTGANMAKRQAGVLANAQQRNQAANTSAFSSPYPASATPTPLTRPANTSAFSSPYWMIPWRRHH